MFWEKKPAAAATTANENGEFRMVMNIPTGAYLLKSNQFQDALITVVQHKVSGELLLQAGHLLQVPIAVYTVQKTSITATRRRYELSHSRLPEGSRIAIEIEAQQMQPAYEIAFDHVMQTSAAEFHDQTNSPPDYTALDLQPIPSAPSSEELGKPKRNKTDKVASAIESGANKIGSGLNSAAKYASKKIDKYADHYVETTTPNEKPTEVSKDLQRALAVGKSAARGAAVGIKAVAGVIGAGVGHVADKVADNVGGVDEKTKLRKAIKIGGATVNAFGTVLNSVEDSARDVSKSVRTGSVKMVDHKHGEQAAKALNDGLKMIECGTRAVFYLDDIALKSIAVETSGKLTQNLNDHKRASTMTDRAVEQSPMVIVANTLRDNIVDAVQDEKRFSSKTDLSSSQ